MKETNRDTIKTNDAKKVAFKILRQYIYFREINFDKDRYSVLLIYRIIFFLNYLIEVFSS